MYIASLKHGTYRYPTLRSNRLLFCSSRNRMLLSESCKVAFGVLNLRPGILHYHIRHLTIVLLLF